MKVDYIVIGAGSAGCIIAEGLSRSGQYSVLLLEAGGKLHNPWIKVPAGIAIPPTTTCTKASQKAA